MIYFDAFGFIVRKLGRKDLLSVDAFAPERVVVVHNGADEAELRDRPTKESARETLGLPHDAEIVGTVALLHPEKNVKMLVRAFARIAARRPRAMLVVAGDGPEFVDCLALARQLGVQDRVRFLGIRRDVSVVLAALDAFALASDREGLPLAVLEAMGAEQPVATTDAGAIREAVDAGVNGFVVPVGDEAALAESIERLLGDPAASGAMGRRGGEMFRSDFTLERMASSYGRVYREAMEGAL